MVLAMSKMSLISQVFDPVFFTLVNIFIRRNHDHKGNVQLGAKIVHYSACNTTLAG